MTLIPADAWTPRDTGWTYAAKVEVGDADYTYRWRLAVTPMEDGDYCLQWYDDAVRRWTFVKYMSLDDVYLRVYGRID